MLPLRTKRYRRLLAGTATVFFLLATILPVSLHAEAFHGDHPETLLAGHKSGRMFYPRPGHHVKVLPRGHRIVKAGPRSYHFHKGVFYRPGPGGFVVVSAPIGARIHVLPAAAVMLTIGAITYWTYAGVYYQKVTDGYMVVTRPVKPATPDAVIAWEGDQVHVTAALLNVRSGPGREHLVIRQVKQGDLLTVRSSSTDWYYVKLPDNSFGWVMLKYTALVKPKAVG